MTWRRSAVLMALLAASVTGTALASGAGSKSRTAYLVEITAGPDPAIVALARASASREGASMRIARSPSESLAVAASLVARGARRLVVGGVDERAVVSVLRSRRPEVEVVRLRSR